MWYAHAHTYTHNTIVQTRLCYSNIEMITLLRMHFHCSFSNIWRLHENGLPVLVLVVSKLLIVCKSMSKVVISFTRRLTHTRAIFFFIQTFQCILCACTHTIYSSDFPALVLVVIKQLQWTSKRNACNINLISFWNSMTHQTEMATIQCNQQNYETWKPSHTFYAG